MTEEEMMALMQEASKETEAILAADPSRANDPTLPVYRQHAKFKLETERMRFELGDKMALFGAIRLCANHDMVMPEWVAQNFIAGYDKVLNFRSNSWDEVFGKPYKGKNLETLRRHRELRVRVWMEINKRLRSDTPPSIDTALFEDVGQSLHIGKTLCSELYYEAKRMFGDPSP